MKITEIVDLRSDTLTLPTEEMLESIRNAQLGDDVYGEDQTVNRLEEMAAERMGKEASLLVPSGTMANLISLMCNAKRADLVVLESESHIYWYEAGGVSAIAGLLPWPVKSRLGAFDPEDVEAAIRPANIHFPTPSLLCVENTHNRHGGTILTPKQLETLGQIAKAHGLRFYMDGARLFNAAVALRTDVREFTKHVDNLMFCLSKGLSCPAGSLIVGTQDFIEKARKARKILGGGMRQAGIIAAPGIVALEKMVNRLEEDHINAKLLAEGIEKIDNLKVDLGHVQTNIVLFGIGDLGASDSSFLSALKNEGVLAAAIGKNKIRLVTHRGIGKEHVSKAISAIENVVVSIQRG